MYKALSQYPEVTKMTPPEGVVQRRICPKSGLLSTGSCVDPYDEWFVSGSEPESTCDVCTGLKKEDEYEMNDIPIELLKKHKPKYNNLLKKE
jgi:membrane carboxypeptidase/penicillin-binding protein